MVGPTQAANVVGEVIVKGKPGSQTLPLANVLAAMV